MTTRPAGCSTSNGVGDSVRGAHAGGSTAPRAPTTRRPARRSCRRAASCRRTGSRSSESWPSTRWDKPGGPFAPHTGNQYVYSQIADVTYKRLTREITVPGGGGDLTFWTSYDTEADWDFLAVEARTADGDDWTTLPEANGHTTQSTRARAARPDGSSCIRSWSATRRSTTRPRRRARPRATAASGTRRRATPTAGSSGRSTWTTTPGRPSRSRSPTSATGRRRASASSSTT